MTTGGQHEHKIEDIIDFDEEIDKFGIEFDKELEVIRESVPPDHSQIIVEILVRLDAIENTISNLNRSYKR